MKVNDKTKEKPKVKAKPKNIVNEEDNTSFNNNEYTKMRDKINKPKVERNEDDIERIREEMIRRMAEG